MAGRKVLFLIPLLLGTLSAYSQESPQDRINRLFQTSQTARESQEWERAESDLREILGTSLDQLGVIESALGDFELAEECFQEAIRASVSSASSLLSLSILYLRTGRYQEGIATAEKILWINPLHPGGRHVLGKIYFMQGDFAQAASQLQDSYQTNRDDFSVAYTLALAHLRQQKLAPAKRVFDELVEQRGESAQLRLLFGRAYRETNYFDEAILEFRRALELSPTAPRANHYLGLTYLLQRGSSAFPEAAKAFQAELENDPEAYFPNFFLGVMAAHDRQNETALKYLRLAIRAQPDNPDPYVHLGQAASQAGNYQEAVEALTRAVELTEDPARNRFQIANAHFILGRALLKLDQSEQARVHLAESSRLNQLKQEREAQTNIKAQIMGQEPSMEAFGEQLDQVSGEASRSILLENNPPDEEARRVLTNTGAFYRQAVANAYQQLGRLMTERSRFVEASRFLAKSLKWDESLQGGYFNLSLARLKADNCSEAVDSLIQAIERRQSAQQAYQLLGHCTIQLVEAHDREPARRAIAYLLQLNPGVPDLYLMKGHLHAQEGHFAEALLEYQRAVSLSKDVSQGHYFSGTVLIRLGRLEEALAAFERQLEQTPQHVGSLYHKAFVLLTHQQPETAIPLLQQVLRLDPAHADAYYQLGKVQLDQENTLLAIANLETAAHLNPGASHVFYQLSRAYTRSGRKDDASRALQTYRDLKKEEEESQLNRRKLSDPD